MWCVCVLIFFSNYVAFLLLFLFYVSFLYHTIQAWTIFVNVQDVFPVIPGDTDYRIFSQDNGNIPGLDIIFLLGGYFYHTSYDTIERLLYASYPLFYFKYLNWMTVCIKLIPPPTWGFPISSDLEASKHVVIICSA